MRPYKVSVPQKAIIEKASEMIRLGVIFPAITGWSAPVTLVTKQDGSIRFCVDHRRLNEMTKKDSYPTPRIDEAFAVMRGSNCF